MDLFNSIVQVLTGNPLTTETRSSSLRLADNVCQRMDEYEEQKRLQSAPSCFGLYGHWVLSLFGFI